MEIAFLSAAAALTGSLIGGTASFFSTWLGRNSQFKANLFLQDKERRQELYREFIDEASASYINALTSNTPDLPKAIYLYALINRMRVISSAEVVEKADKVARQIIECYPEPNKTFSELHLMVAQSAIDPLRGFSEACRKELYELAPN